MAGASWPSRPVRSAMLRWPHRISSRRWRMSSGARWACSAVRASSVLRGCMEGTAKSVPPSLNEGDETAMTMQRLHTGWRAAIFVPGNRTDEAPSACWSVAPFAHRLQCWPRQAGGGRQWQRHPGRNRLGDRARSRRIPTWPPARPTTSAGQSGAPGRLRRCNAGRIAEVHSASAAGTGHRRQWQACRPTTATTAATSRPGRRRPSPDDRGTQAGAL